MIIQSTEKELLEQLKNNISNKKYSLIYKYVPNKHYTKPLKSSLAFNIINKKNLLIYSGYLLDSNGYFIKIFKKAGIKNIILDIREDTSKKYIKNILGENYNEDCYIIKPYKSSNDSRMCIVIVNLKKIKL